MTNTGDSRVISVWDPFVRLGHWALAAAFTIAYLTGEEESQTGDWHEWAGYAAGAIVAWRIIWGFAGPRYARFSDFAVWPRSARAYLIDLAAGRSRRYVGHSPAGGAMIIALLAFIGATVVTGIIADQDGNGQRAQASSTFVAQAAQAGESAENEESLIGEAHGVLANITLALVLLHICGVVLASFAHRENLAAAMITGKKRGEDTSE